MKSVDELPGVLQERAQSLLDQGWSIILMPDQPTDVRVRLEAEHASGHRVMVVARPSNQPGRPTVWRGRNVRYFAQPTGSDRWYRLGGAASLDRYATTLALDPGSAPFTAYDPAALPHTKTPRKRCDCAKKQFTGRRAAEALLDAKIQREVQGVTRRRERRSYQCEVDPRVWHLTSRKEWHA
ncbi:hypothetical protein [Streptomyces sp. SGAir0957]